MRGYQCPSLELQVAPCNDTCMQGDATVAARSYHPGGVNVVFADGHVDFYSDDVDLYLWQALSTVAGGEVIGEHEK